ncbi:hypothetical protein [Paenibacillus oleatilyticus]|uniref:hypothetical protein n=1 Tax=Paenibacillus oleatilyticus TaxID=2594886 RepID=UPI001C1FC47F|nr:hypothetical protein [Paenibacillus oleatilyticus]MBU7316050.1 hypothetical protein [Paenibacillus oleatilyticus]
MNGKQLFELFRSGAKPIVEFTEGCQDYESFDPKMKARLICMWEDDECLGCEFDFSEFVDFNKSIEQPVWYGRNNELLKWSESSYYPKAFKVRFYIDENETPYFKIAEESIAYSDYKKSGSTKAYVEWLEEQYIIMKR